MDDREAARLDALRSYRILDTDSEKAFDDLVLLASQICETPIALISLVDEDSASRPMNIKIRKTIRMDVRDTRKMNFSEIHSRGRAR